MPVVLVTLVESHRLLLKSAVGLPESVAVKGEALPSPSFCRHVIEAGAPLVIGDARMHDLARENPVFRDTGFVAYLGVPLRGPEGETLGALCAMDDAPRAWSEADEQTLSDLAATLTSELRFRITVNQLERERQAHAGTRSLTSAALDALPDLFFLTDGENRLLRWNQWASEVTGYADSEFNTRSVTDFFAPSDRERVRDAMEQVLRGGTAQVEARLLTEDGRTIPYEFTGALLRDASGAPLGVCGTGRDVTERNHMQRELQKHLHALEQANKRFSAIVDSTPGVIFQCVHEPDGSITFPFISSGAISKLDLDLSVLLEDASRLSDFVHPDDNASLWAAIEASRDSHDPWAWEGRALAKDGSVRWVSVRACPTRLTDGRPLWNGLVHDVTEQRQTEEALRLSEARHRGLIEANPDLFLRFSREGRYLDVRAQDAEELLVAEPSELVGRTISEFLPGEEAARWLEVIEEALTTRRLQRYEYELVTLDGESHHFEARLVPVGTDEVQAIVRDISDRRRYELGLVQAIEAAEEARARAEEARLQAEEAARVKSSLLTNMSHEIRTPLTGILGFAEIIAEESGDELEEYARYIGASGRRLLDTLNSVLDLAQIEAHRYPLVPVEFDLALVACDTAELQRHRACTKGVALRLLPPPAPLPISTDQDAFARVVTNLVSNAVKFTEEGAVTLSARALPATGEAELRVEDTGVGIDEDFLPLLFEEFRQESEGEDRSYEGSGLGLCITKRLVEIMGGTITVESQKGAGSTFTVRLPLARPRARTNPLLQPEEESSSG